MNDRNAERSRKSLAAGWTFILIAAPLAVTFLVQRAVLHFVNHDIDFFVAGREVHHLFTGALVAIPAAFVLAFEVRILLVRSLSLAMLGIGVALVLDEVIFLIYTDGSNVSYLTPVSFWGAVIFESLAIAFLAVLYWLFSRAKKNSRS